MNGGAFQTLASPPYPGRQILPKNKLYIEIIEVRLFLPLAY